MEGHRNHISQSSRCLVFLSVSFSFFTPFCFSYFLGGPIADTLRFGPPVMELFSPYLCVTDEQNAIHKDEHRLCANVLLGRSSLSC